MMRQPSLLLSFPDLNHPEQRLAAQATVTHLAGSDEGSDAQTLQGLLITSTEQFSLVTLLLGCREYFRISVFFKS